MPGSAGMLGRVRKRSEIARAALLGNGMAWFGAAMFLLGLAGGYLDAVTAGPWPRAVGFSVVVAAGVGLAVGGALNTRRIRSDHGRLH